MCNLLDETKQALQYYDKSFEVWRKLHDKNFMLLAARHAFGLAHTLGDQEKITVNFFQSSMLTFLRNIKVTYSRS